jgi:hypothetical protein
VIVSTRGDAVAIASTLIRPSAFSICASIPIFRPRSHGLLDLGHQEVRRTTCCGVCTFGSMIASGSRHALHDLRDVAVGPVVVQSLTRTTLVFPPQSPVFSASTIRCRALSLASGAHASSRSRKN